MKLVVLNSSVLAVVDELLGGPSFLAVEIGDRSGITVNTIHTGAGLFESFGTIVRCKVPQ